MRKEQEYRRAWKVFMLYKLVTNSFPCVIKYKYTVESFSDCPIGQKLNSAHLGKIFSLQDDQLEFVIFENYANNTQAQACRSINMFQVITWIKCPKRGNRLLIFKKRQSLCFILPALSFVWKHSVELAKPLHHLLFFHLKATKRNEIIHIF